MKVQEEAVTCVLNDKDELVAVARRNGHVTFYDTKEMGIDKVTKMLQAMVPQQNQ